MLGPWPRYWRWLTCPAQVCLTKALALALSWTALLSLCLKAS